MQTNEEIAAHHAWLEARGFRDGVFTGRGFEVSVMVNRNYVHARVSHGQGSVYSSTTSDPESAIRLIADSSARTPDDVEFPAALYALIDGLPVLKAPESLTYWTDVEGCDGNVAICNKGYAGKAYVWLQLHHGGKSAVHALTPEQAEGIAVALNEYAAKVRAENALAEAKNAH